MVALLSAFTEYVPSASVTVPPPVETITPTPMSGSPVVASLTEPVTTFCANAAVVMRLKRKMKKLFFIVISY